MKKVVKIFIDFDGTICGESSWKSFFHNTMRVFKTGLLMDIPNHSWSILTARPKFDKWIIQKACKKYSLYPDEIITSPTLFYKFKNEIDRANWKSSVLSKHLNSMFVTDVVYVDDDPENLAHIMNQQGLTLCRPNMLGCVMKEFESNGKV